MAKTRRFFAAEAGRFLKSRRQRRGLTLKQVADGLELAESGGKGFVRRLEQGKVGDPALSTIVRYLRAVGARLSDIEPVLDRAEFVPVPDGMVAQAKISPARKGEVLAEAGRDGLKYQLRMLHPAATPALPPPKRRQASERFLEFMVMVRIVREAVRDYLSNTKTSYYQWEDYQVFGRSRLGALRRLTGAKRKKRLAEIDARAAARGLKPDVLTGVRRAVDTQFGELTRDPELLPRIRQFEREQNEQIQRGLQRRARLEPEVRQQRAACDDELWALMPEHRRRHKAISGTEFGRVLDAYLECWLSAAQVAEPGTEEFRQQRDELMAAVPRHFVMNVGDVELAGKLREIVKRRLEEATKK